MLKENMPAILRITIMLFSYKNYTKMVQSTTESQPMDAKSYFFCIKCLIRRFEEKAAEQYTTENRGFTFVH
jgi:YHS domain-containing protein